ncbi:hypothetical protein [Mastigocoleus testarum]|uniref:Uncharacterized protein n=1 Tax=Mastigocoleus testarum BC008 TaxID=371196 RepID=A0A0V7ZGP5_9CYAN|nr:hypothetical protein [Mastigocoleus testarum]KST63618.1 hypothetical protein BC008_14245 [Mastigocoleus testarum BC008]
MKKQLLKNEQQNDELSCDLQAKVEQVSNIAENETIDSKTQEKIQSLLIQIKTGLQQQELNIEMQRELARLLSLMSRLDYRSPQQVDILDLAISVLLEKKEDTTKSLKNSNLLNKASSKHSRNLVFIQEARRQIALQSREYPNPLSAIIKGNGGAYNRMISGLSWFFMIFVVSPFLGVGLIFTISNIFSAREIVEKENIEQLQKNLDYKREELERTNEINNAFRSRLTKVDDELKPLVAGSSNEQDGQTNTLKTLQNEIEQELKSATKKERGLNFSTKINPVVLNQDAKSSANQNPNNKDASGELDRSDGVSELILFTDWFVKQDLFFISLAISMGALGSAVSVIVRANKFIEQSKEGQVDLFFTGFFRPIVGMSFAIFAVALIESGIFFGISSTSDNMNRDKMTNTENRNGINRTVYFYMAIAFITGFSERLAEDVVLRAEETLGGFPSASKKSDE